MAPHAARSRKERDPNTPARLPAEPLRDQVFAACGYAFTIAALAASLLTAYLGTLALIFGAVLATLLVPVNMLAIRHYARTRRPPTTRRTVWRAGRRSWAATRRSTPQR